MEKSRGNSPWRIVTIFLISRVILELIGLLSFFYFPSARSIFPMTDLKYHAQQPAYLEMWARWDSEWYLLIAEKGYASYDLYKDYGNRRYLAGDTAKFFPAYPFAIGLVSKLTKNPVLAGILISNFSAILFLYYFHRLSSHLSDSETADQSSIFYIVFPTSFFLSAVYPESLFLAMLTMSFYYVEMKRLPYAALAGVIAVLCRPQGILAVPALLWLAIQRMPDRRAFAIGVLAGTFCVALAAYLYYLDRTLGSYRLVLQSQNYWRGEMHYPLYALVRFAHSHIAIHGQHNSLIDFGFATLNLLVLVLSFRLLPRPYYLYSIIAVLIPLSSTLFSFSRLCLVNFPMFFFLGSRMQGRWAFLMQMGFAMLLAFFMAAFANWYWVG